LSTFKSLFERPTLTLFYTDFSTERLDEIVVRSPNSLKKSHLAGGFESGILERVNEPAEAFYDLSQDLYWLDEGNPDEAIGVEPKPVSRAQG
jgi:hypothetical protein